MNILTKNRILQKGDEYRSNGNGEWKPVPKDNFGLQIEFTDYKEVRRPSEQPFPVSSNGPSNDSHPSPPHAETKISEGVKRSPSARTTPPSGNNPGKAAKCAASGGETISKSRKAGQSDEIATPRQAEGDKSPATSHSVAGDAPEDDPPFSETANAANYLPTVVSKKAHSQERDREIIDSIPYDLPMTDEEMAALEREKHREEAAPMATALAKLVTALSAGEIEKAAAKIKARASVSAIEKIDFPNGGNPPIWTGRNGTFNGYGLELMRNNDIIMVSPIGKRGVGNCTIQLPVSVASKLASWLLEQATPKK
jgi:hypothetical protein